MYEIITVEDSIRVQPENIGLDKKESVMKALASKYENKILMELKVLF